MRDRVKRTLQCVTRNKWVYRPLLAAISIIFVIGTWQWAEAISAERQTFREALVGQNDRIIECTTPGMACFEEAQRRSTRTLSRAFTEIDCAHRRALAGLHALTEGSCPEQTPLEVYPGRPSGG